MIYQWIECTRRSRILFGILLVTNVAAAPAPDAAPVQTQVISEGGRYLLTYRTHPAPIVLNEPFELLVRVRERYKQSPAKNISLEIDAGMLAHNHGMFTKPEAIPAGAGEFLIKGMLFHMPGEWNLTFILYCGLMKDRVITDIVVD